MQTSGGLGRSLATGRTGPALVDQIDGFCQRVGVLVVECFCDVFGLDARADKLLLGEKKPPRTSRCLTLDEGLGIMSVADEPGAGEFVECFGDDGGVGFVRSQCGGEIGPCARTGSKFAQGAFFGGIDPLAAFGCKGKIRGPGGADANAEIDTTGFGERWAALIIEEDDDPTGATGCGVEA